MEPFLLPLLQERVGGEALCRINEVSDSNNIIYMVSSSGVDGMSSSIAISLTYGYTDGSTSNVRSP